MGARDRGAEDLAFIFWSLFDIDFAGLQRRSKFQHHIKGDHCLSYVAIVRHFNINRDFPR